MDGCAITSALLIDGSFTPGPHIDCHFDHTIPSVLKKLASHCNIPQRTGVGDQRGVDLSLLNQRQNFSAPAAVHSTGPESDFSRTYPAAEASAARRIKPPRLRSRSAGRTATPTGKYPDRQSPPAPHPHRHARCASEQIHKYSQVSSQHLRIMLLRKGPPLRVLFAYNDLLRSLQ